jgi:hypothetical protein
VILNLLNDLLSFPGTASRTEYRAEQQSLQLRRVSHLSKVVKLWLDQLSPFNRAIDYCHLLTWISLLYMSKTRHLSPLTASALSSVILAIPSYYTACHDRKRFHLHRLVRSKHCISTTLSPIPKSLLFGSGGLYAWRWVFSVFSIRDSGVRRMQAVCKQQMSEALGTKHHTMAKVEARRTNGSSKTALDSAAFSYR